MLVMRLVVVFLAVLAVSACTSPGGKVIQQPETSKKQAVVDCIPFERDLTREWSSKRGYCIGDDRVSYRPIDNSRLVVPAPKTRTSPRKDSSILNDDVDAGRWEIVEPEPSTTTPDQPKPDKPTPVIVTAIEDTPAVEVKRTDKKGLREINFMEGSSDLSKSEERRLLDVVKNLPETESNGVIWLQASLTKSETDNQNASTERLGVNRSLAVKSVLANLGFTDIRIMFPKKDAVSSTVSLILKGEA